ncbi:MAG: phosphoenolpyruvate carboxykinase (ATP) [Gemmataceae bacterium]|nr:phosphoenolpyruvate carboxykinase (ATP) [Gemmataceae bacterium]
MADMHTLGLPDLGAAHVNLPPARLVEMALERSEATLTDRGALRTSTEPHTGRAARDKYVVADSAAQDRVWWGDVNQRLTPAVFAQINERVAQHLAARQLFVFEGWACADPRHRLPVRVVTENAWHALFAHIILRRPTAAERAGFQPAVTILHAPDLQLDPARDGTRSGAAIILGVERGQIVISGTHYAGEIKKSVFSYLNYWLPERGVFPMHCSATLGPDGDTALLFGLSGTGKTTLSADPMRQLIGDDEHGWSEHGIFNFEGGCYAKCIRLSEASEPQIYHALGFGSILENVIVDPATRRPNFDDTTITENTRAAYPLEHIPGAEPTGQGPPPRHVFFLTCDAYGVLPPVSRLTREQAMYHFLSGYTAKIGGTEAGIKEPSATFSACFSAPFLTLPPMRYAELLRERLEKSGAQVWLVNTGWTGGAYGRGKRFPIAVTRRLVHAALAGELDRAEYAADPMFGLHVPTHCPGVPDDVFQPRRTWPAAEDYDRQAQRLAKLFRDNFQKHFGAAPDAVRAAGPR